MGNGMCKAQQSKSRMAGAQREGRWPEIQQEGQKAQTMQGLWLRHLIFSLKAPGSHCRIFSKGTVCVSGKCHWLPSEVMVGRESMNVVQEAPVPVQVMVVWTSIVPAGNQRRSV